MSGGSQLERKTAGRDRVEEELDVEVGVIAYADEVAEAEQEVSDGWKEVNESNLKLLLRNLQASNILQVVLDVTTAPQ
eukprot:44747-Hanusia_phi.AAC.1